MASTHQARRAGRAAPVLLVVLHPDGAALCGPAGEKPAVRLRLDRQRVERICREALLQPDRHSALRFLSQALPSLETDLPGIHNEGLLALHNLRFGVRKRPDWTVAGSKAKKAVGARALELLDALDFTVAPLDNLTHMLLSGADGRQRTALAVLLHDSESAEAGSPRFNSLSPVTYALKKADDENLPWVLMVQGNRLRLYSTATDQGVGRRGRTETYVECQTPLLADPDLAYLWLIFSAEALAPNGSLDQILDDSRRFAGDLAERLRERIYDQVVPKLARGIADAREFDAVTTPELARTYDMALTVLFRLLFIAYAEDCDLLPYRTNDAYRRRSLKQKAQELAKQARENTPVAPGDAHWQEVAQLCEAVSAGNPEWGVSEYDGGLFSSDPTVSEAGAELARLSLPNEAFEAALRHLLIIETHEGGLGPVDFRSLGVREFGTIYEGLLEAELAVATVDLAVDSKGTYLPAKPRARVVVQKGETYLHNRSGVRKFTGSYYTKPFAVEHLLDKALEPALKDHFRLLQSMDDATAAERFFDFRVADIAMGSGHFLVGAIDRIEKGMADFLVGRDLPGVRNELAELRQAARIALGDDDAVGTALVEDGQLLRRLIARRCIYGVDLNDISVQLARLAVWIHTFVPGLPLSFLDHNLIRGNSLVGIGTVGDIKAKLEAADTPLFVCDAESLLGKAAKPLRRLANLNDATVAEVRQARQAQQEAEEAVAATKALCDLITAQPITNRDMIKGFQFQDWERRSENLESVPEAAVAAQEMSGLAALHFPVAFPEVFLRDRPGFDVMLGNPPWKKPKVEEHGFWARHFPGLRGMSQRDQEAEKARFRQERPDLVAVLEDEVKENDDVRRALLGGDFPGMGTGDADVYKAFCWRFWRLTAENRGRIGVVLPRSALQAKGSQDFRKVVFGEASSMDAVALKNRAGWVFESVTPQYTIVLVAIVRRGDEEQSRLRMSGPYSDLHAFGAGMAREPLVFYRRDIEQWNDSASLPMLPSHDSVAVFAQMSSAPRLDTRDDTSVRGGGGARLACTAVSRDGRHRAKALHGVRKTLRWRARPITEIHTTAQKAMMRFEARDSYWPVYKGASFDLWAPDKGAPYAWANPAPVLDWLQNKRLRAAKSRRDSAHKEFPMELLRDRSTLPCFKPRIAFRDVARATDKRTIIACLLPPRVFVVHNAPYFLWPRGDERDQAFLLGVLCSIPLDWYARRFVETHVTYFVINPFPIPRPGRDAPLWKRTVQIAGRLACPDERFAEWAEAVGVDWGPLAEDEKQDLVHELDAIVAHCYGLTERQLVHVFESFREGWNYHDRLDAVLKHFRDVP